MSEPSVMCPLVAAMIAKHRWGTPIGENALIRLSAVPKHDYPEARAAFESLQRRRFITHQGSREIALDNSEFGELAEFLYHTCGWAPDEIKLRLKHYEGWEEHHWA